MAGVRHFRHATGLDIREGGTSGARGTFLSLFPTYPNQSLNSERPRKERNFQSISKNGAKREDPFGYGRVKWQESAISGMRPVLSMGHLLALRLTFVRSYDCIFA